jgi:hypothetical protein
MRFQDLAPQLPDTRNLIHLRRKTYKLRHCSVPIYWNHIMFAHDLCHSQIEYLRSASGGLIFNLQFRLARVRVFIPRLTNGKTIIWIFIPIRRFNRAESQPNTPVIRRQSLLFRHLPDLRCARIYLSVIKMLNFCYTFWFGRGYLVHSHIQSPSSRCRIYEPEARAGLSLEPISLGLNI